MELSIYTAITITVTFLALLIIIGVLYIKTAILKKISEDTEELLRHKEEYSELQKQYAELLKTKRQ